MLILQKALGDFPLLYMLSYIKVFIYYANEGVIFVTFMIYKLYFILQITLDWNVALIKNIIKRNIILSNILSVTLSKKRHIFFVLFLFLLQDNCYYCLVLKFQVSKLKIAVEVTKLSIWPQKCLFLKRF